MKQSLVLAFVLVSTAGCTSKTPLIFVSKTSVGVEVSAPGTGTGEFNASIGVNTLDAAYVPVIERIKAQNETVHEVKSGESLSATERQNLANLLAQQIQNENDNISLFQAAKDKAGASPDDIKTAQANIDATRERVQTLSADLGNVLSRNDALSVFSAFDSNTVLRSAEAGQGVGKIFATGLAAQNISRNFSLASCKEKIAPTVATLAASAQQTDKELAVKLLEACK